MGIRDASPWTRACLAVALVALLIHALPQPGYGFHRDELLYFAMGDHLDLFRMQFPPLIAIFARGSSAVFGDAVLSARVLPALAHAVLVLLAAAIARDMGGNGPARLLAAVCVLVGPMFVRAGLLFQPVIFELLWSTVATWAFVHLLADGDRRTWLVLGVALGLGALTKFSAAVWAISLAAGILASPLRRDLGTRWAWLALAIAVPLGIPSLTGQVTWGWPFFDQIAALREDQLARVTLGEFLSGQLLMDGPAAPILFIGFVALFRDGRFRGAGVAAAVMLALLLALQGKDYYYAPMHPLLLAAGSVAVTGWIEKRAWRPAYATVVTLILIGGAILLPVGTPILSPPLMARYAGWLGLTEAVRTNRGTILPLPQDFADMIGWEEQVAAVSAVYHRLGDSDQRAAVIVGGNYGRAGALQMYARRFGLPAPISRHGDFYNWGPGDRPGDVVIIVGGTVDELSAIFGEVEEVARVSRPMGVEEEQEVRIHVCRRPRKTIHELWRELGPVWG